MRNDDELAGTFLQSLRWRRNRRFRPWLRRNGIRELVESFLRTEYNVPHNGKTPRELFLTTYRVARIVQSEWSKAGADARPHYDYLRRVRRAEHAHKKYRARKRAWEEPSLFD